MGSVHPSQLATPRDSTMALRWWLLAATSIAAQAKSNVHVVFSTECYDYFDWQSATLLDSARRVGLDAPITRLMACDYPNPSGLDIVEDTFVHPNYARSEKTGDYYPPHNKPKSLELWLEHTSTDAEYILILDTDMVFANDFDLGMFDVSRGKASSAKHEYLFGLRKSVHMNIKQALRHPNDAEMVGGFYLMHKEDLRKVAPLWYNYSAIIRADPGNWPVEGKSNKIHADDPPWIAEMYGYSFACAELGIRHDIPQRAILYPGYAAFFDPWPIFIHYALLNHVEDYAFDKHWFHKYDMLKCPGKLFPKPPAKEELVLYPKLDRYAQRREDLSLYTLHSIYNSTRDLIARRCGGVDNAAITPREYYVCKQIERPESCVTSSKEEAHEFLRSLPEFEGRCIDRNKKCPEWAKRGECTNNISYMAHHCKASCNLCHDSMVVDYEERSSSAGRKWSFFNRRIGPKDNRNAGKGFQKQDLISSSTSMMDPESPLHRLPQKTEGQEVSFRGLSSKVTNNIGDGNRRPASARMVRPYHIFGVLSFMMMGAFALIYWKLSGRRRALRRNST